MRVRRIVGVGFSVLLLAGAGWAAELTDTTTEMVCSITEVNVCRTGAPCETAAPGDFGAPDLVLVSLADSAFLALGESHVGRRSAFRLVERTGERWVLQGYERSRAWSAVIDAGGAMTLAATSSGVAVAAVGHCVDAAWLRE
jgi:hypothetical protein